MKTTLKNSGKLRSRAAIPKSFCHDLAQDQVPSHSGEWANDATLERLLDLFLLCPSDASSLRDLTEFRFAMPADLCETLDNLIDVSAKMRGLIFRAYARRINELMQPKGADSSTLAPPTIGGRPN